MKLSIIEVAGICRLGGFEGSNPELLSLFPGNQELLSEQEDMEEFISKSLPFGISPDSFSRHSFQQGTLFSYTFELRSANAGTRNDLAAITLFVSDKKVNIDQFEQLFKSIMTAFKDEMEKLTPTLLTNTIERIYNGVNKNEKININKIIVDVPGMIKHNKWKLIKTDISQLKGAFD